MINLMQLNKFLMMIFITYVLNWFGYFQIWKQPMIDKHIPLNLNRRRQFNISSPTVFLTKVLSWILINPQFSIIITDISAGHSIPPSAPRSVAVFNWIINNRKYRQIFKKSIRRLQIFQIKKIIRTMTISLRKSLYSW